MDDAVKNHSSLLPQKEGGFLLPCKPFLSRRAGLANHISKWRL